MATLSLALGSVAVHGADAPPAPAAQSTRGQTPAAPAPAATKPADSDGLYELGQQLFDQFAPPDVKAQYDFPTEEQWQQALQKLPALLQSDSLDDLASYAPQGRAILATLRSAGIEPEVVDWLQQRIDEAEGARDAQAELQQPARPRPQPPGVPSPQTPSAPPSTPPLKAAVPHYGLWLARVQDRPVPERASVLMPVLQQAFKAEGVPPALAWMAEAESTLNPAARSPTGARGLFQLMPDTARHLGLDTFLPDERTDPEKSAHAAARYLRTLHDKFGGWPLALAAYNAGEGRVSRALAARKGTTFADIADALPAETRMYVPKVCALVSVRSGVSVASL